MLQSIYCTNKSCTLIHYNKNTDVADYNQVFISGMKFPKEVCLHHIEHEPVILTAEEIYSYMIAHQVHQLLHMQGCSFYLHGSILGMYQIER